MPLNCASVRLLNCCWPLFPPNTVDVTMRSSNRLPSRLVNFVTVVICSINGENERVNESDTFLIQHCIINLPHHRFWKLSFPYSLAYLKPPARRIGGSRRRWQRPARRNFCRTIRPGAVWTLNKFLSRWRVEIFQRISQNTRFDPSPIHNLFYKPAAN